MFPWGIDGILMITLQGAHWTKAGLLCPCIALEVSFHWFRMVASLPMVLTRPVWVGSLRRNIML